MTQRFWFLVVVIFSLLLMGMANLQGELILLAVPLVVYLAFGLFFIPLKSNWKASREVNASIVEQDALVKVKVNLENQGPNVDELTFEDLSPLPSVDGQIRLFQPAATGEQLELEYTVRCVRGRHAWKDITIGSGESFGLFQRRLEVRAVNEIHTVPAVTHLRNVKIVPRKTHGFSGPISARRSGAGMVFWGVREFHLGDALQQINWKVSSRHEDNLFTNEFEQERITDVGLILDARAPLNLTVQGETLFDYAVLAAAALAETFLYDGHKVSLLTYGYGMQRVFPGYGKIQRERILRALAEATPGSNYALENFNHLPTRLFSAQSQLVVVSPVNPRDYLAYLRLRRDGYEVMVVSPNPVDFEARLYPNIPEVTQATHLARLERSLWLRKLMRLGVLVIDWSVDQPLDRVIHSSLGGQLAFRRNVRAG
jgi:uncharacterized protein (DUF58 family)